MKPRIISWNIRGGCAMEKRRLIRSSLRKWKPDVVCLQETKLRSVNDQVISSLWGGGWCKWLSLESVGASGGLIVMWDCRKLKVEEYECGSFSISCLFHHKEEETSWSFTGVYGPVEKSLKQEFLEELGAAIFRWNKPWCLGGDFNLIRTINEKSGCTRSTKQMKIFSEFIEDSNGIDLPLNGGRYTWSNSLCISRLDRFLISTDWEELFPSVLQKILPRCVSDHFPLLLDGGGLKGGPKPFRFENMWLKFEGFKELVAGWWSNYMVDGSASFRLCQKLKLLKEDLKKWNREVFGRIDHQKLQLEKEIQQLDFQDEEERLTDQGREEKRKD